MVIDYQQLNDITKKDFYPLRISEQNLKNFHTTDYFQSLTSEQDTTTSGSKNRTNTRWHLKPH
jgi:hypothetical protein